MDLIYSGLGNVLAPAIIGVLDLFDTFDHHISFSSILISLFFVTCCYRFIVTHFIGGAPLSPLEALSDNVKAHSKSDRAGNKQKQNDKGKNKSKAVSTSHSSD